MDLATVDLLLRAATFALALAGAAALLIRAPRSDIAWYAAVVVGGMGAFMAASAPQAHRALGLAAVFFNAWCLATPAFVWLLAIRLFSEQPPGRWHFAAPVLLVPLTLAGDYGRFRLGLLGDVPDLAHALLLTGRAAAMLLLLAACAQALAHWRVDLVEQRRRARAAFVTLFGGAFLAMAASTFLFAGQPAPLPLLVGAHLLLLALAFAAVLFIASDGMRWLDQAEAVPPQRPALSLVRNEAPEAALAQRIVAEMQARELWRRERLGIRDLAQELGTQEYRVRRAINRHLGYRNFNEFLHDYRLQAAAGRLHDPAESHLPVLSIALDSGYGSIGPFNRAFKARFGITPSQYRQLRAAAEGADSGIGQRRR
jgi:AraC-like DNA-binding protein